MPDETAELADWVLPIDSPLESWGQFDPQEGVHCLGRGPPQVLDPGLHVQNQHLVAVQ